MRVPPEHQAIHQVAVRLPELLGVPYDADSVSYDVAFAGCGAGGKSSLIRLDAVLTYGAYSFAIEWKGSGSSGQVALAVDKLRRVIRDSPCSLIPLLAVPYMGESGRAYCDEFGIAWLDLSGNAKIVAPGLHVHVFDHSNRFRRPGRPSSAFGPKGSRIARWLLLHPNKAVRQRELASDTGLNEGYVSRVVGKLVHNGLVARDDRGIRVSDAARLLDAWHEEYRFDRHRLISGHIAAMSGDGLVREVTRTLDESNEPYAATGLAAAWHWTQYAGFRLLTIYLEKTPTTELVTALGFREERRGANVWLVVPNDEGVFHGSSRVRGVRCVHPVQTYLDLKAHPERAREAADEIRRRLLS